MVFYSYLILWDIVTSVRPLKKQRIMKPQFTMNLFRYGGGSIVQDILLVVMIVYAFLSVVILLEKYLSLYAIAFSGFFHRIPPFSNGMSSA